MSESPDAILRLWREFSDHEPDAVLGGVYANKGGYHNTRANHRRDRPGDYSIQATVDKLGSAYKAAALDITFNTARASNFRVIAKYTKRLITAMRNRDARLFYRGEAVVRECFGNADDDREVEGYSLYRGYPVTSDDSHLWHIHISFHRKFVESYAAISGVLDVLLNRSSDTPTPQPTVPEDDVLNDDDKQWIKREMTEIANAAATKAATDAAEAAASKTASTVQASEERIRSHIETTETQLKAHTTRRSTARLDQTVADELGYGGKTDWQDSGLISDISWRVRTIMRDMAEARGDTPEAQRRMLASNPTETDTDDDGE